MTVLKPLLCTWLYLTWQHVNQPSMIKKGWAVRGLDRAFNKNFQILAMDEHMKRPLFKDVHLQVENNSNNKEEETDTDMNIQAIMEENLIRVAKFTTINKSGVLTLKGLARKRSVSASAFLHILQKVASFICYKSFLADFYYVSFTKILQSQGETSELVVPLNPPRKKQVTSRN
jgi:hypothetical protein